MLQKVAHTALQSEEQCLIYCFSVKVITVSTIIRNFKIHDLIQQVATREQNTEQASCLPKSLMPIVRDSKQSRSVVVELGVGCMNDGQFLQDAYWLSKSCSSLDVKGSGSTLTSTDVPKMGLQSCPTL